MSSGTAALLDVKTFCPGCAFFPDYNDFNTSAGNMSIQYSSRTNATLSTSILLPSPLSGSWNRTNLPFQALAEPLGLDFDDFIRTSADPRHRPGVEALWRACLARGDLYRRRYRGLYCVGCEAFYTPAELDPEGLCPEHRRPPEVVDEENWFFRLSRFADQLAELITSDRLRIRPEAHKNAALAFLQSGLQDISVSRSVARAK